MELPLVLTGRVVTFDEAQPVLDDGAVYIGADELITAVQPRKDAAPSGFDGARVVRTGGAIYPGLIDLHGHIAYNGLPLWSPPGRIKPYTSRYQWPGDQSYEGMISDPANCEAIVAAANSSPRAQPPSQKTRKALGCCTSWCIADAPPVVQMEIQKQRNRTTNQLRRILIRNCSTPSIRSWTMRLA